MSRRLFSFSPQMSRGSALLSLGEDLDVLKLLTRFISQLSGAKRIGIVIDIHMH